MREVETKQHEAPQKENHPKKSKAPLIVSQGKVYFIPYKHFYVYSITSFIFD